MITPITPIVVTRDLASPVLGPYTITVNTAVVMSGVPNMIGKVYTVINSSASTANILVQAQDGSLIRTVYPGTSGQVTPNTDSPATQAQWEGVDLIASNWTLVSTDSSLFLVDTGTLSIANISVYMKRLGDSIKVRYEWAFNSTQTGWTALTLKLPQSLTLDTSKSVAAANPGNRYLWQNAGSINKPGSFGGIDIVLDSNTAPGLFLVGLRTANGAGTVSGATGFVGITAANQTYSGASINAQVETMLMPITGWSMTKG